MKFFTFITLILFFTSNTLAFQLLRGDEVTGYKQATVIYDYNFAECPFPEQEMIDVFNQAATRWSGIPGTRLESIALGNQVNYTGADVFGTSYPNITSTPVVICDATYGVNGAGQSTPQALGFGVPISTQSEIVGGYIILNFDPATGGGTFNLALPEAASLIGTITHEIGHSLGFAHVDSDSIMVPSGGTDLTARDYDGMRYLYPSEDGIGADFLACGSINNINTNGTGRAALLLLLLPLIALSSLRRTRKNKYHKPLFT